MGQWYYSPGGVASSPIGMPTVQQAAGPQPYDPPFIRNWTPAANATLNSLGWDTEVSSTTPPATENISFSTDHMVHTYGGYDNNLVGVTTHFARIRRKLPERDGVVAEGQFTLWLDYYLPSNYYTQHEAYVRFMNSDNFKTTLGGAPVGSLDADEWRFGFYIYGGDKKFRILSEHENHAWAGSELWVSPTAGATFMPVGRHTIELYIDPQKTATGAFWLKIDDVEVANVTGVATVPPTVSDPEMVVTRAVFGPDGAAQQDTKVETFHTYGGEFTASM